MRRRKGLNKDDVVDLQRSIPHRDVIAEKQGKPVHHGSIEAAENQIPWLRERRKRRPQG